GRFSWCGIEPSQTSEWSEIQVQVRAHGEQLAAEFRVADGEMQIRLNEPLMGVAPGQTAVIYKGTRVLGQMTIDHTVSAVAVGAE
ncbi:MAG: aminomethyltransferase beta-barrel domain-containing protein, partial [Rhodoluna sp.]